MAMTRKEFVELALVALADNEDAVEVGNKMLVSLSKKRPSSGKLTAKQVANAALVERVRNILAEASEPLSIAMIINALDDETVSTSQKVVPLIKAIPNMTKETVKGKVFYSLSAE